MQPNHSAMPPTAFARSVQLRSFTGTRPGAQCGSVLIQFAVFMAVIFTILGVVDLGYSLYAKRDLQRIADLAAIEAVQGIDLSDPDVCGQTGNLSIGSNWPAPIKNLSPLPVECGKWDKDLPDSQGRHFTAGFSPQNAARVVLTGETPRFFPGTWSRVITAEAIAQRTEPAMAFQIGSQLLRLNPDAALGKLLTTVGLDVDDLSVLDAAGLANAKITPAGLLEALGIELGVDGLAVLTADQALKLSKLTMRHILDASLELISESTLEADITAAIAVLEGLKIGGTVLLDTPMTLLGDSSLQKPGIFTFLSVGKSDSPNKAALDAQVSMGSVLNTAIMLAAHGHALEMKDTALLNTVKLGMTVVEPPTIVVGPRASGNSAQIRLNLDIDSKGLPVLGPLLEALGLRVKLPVRIDGVSADGTLVQTHQCSKEFPQGAIDVEVDSRVARITIGNPDPGATLEDNLLIKTPLSLNVRGPVSVEVLRASTQTLEEIRKGETKVTDANELLLGDTLGALTDALFHLLGGMLSPPTLATAWQGMTADGSVTQARDAQIEMLADHYLEQTKENGLYKVDAAINLILNGRDTEGSEDYLVKLVNTNFTFNNAIPTTCGLLGLTVCTPDKWEPGTFSAAFKAYTSTNYSLLDLVGINTLGNGYSSCAGLLSSLLAWNSCVKSNLRNLLKKQYAQVNLTDANAMVNSLANQASSGVTCNGALCVLLKPLLTPIKAWLNGVGKTLLSPLLNDVLGLELGRNEVKALDISCNTAELVY